MRILTFVAPWLMAAAPAFAVQVIVGGAQAAEGFPFYGC